MLKFLNSVPSATAWTPDSGVTGHMGQPILEESDFFVCPPLEIGRIISAETTLSQTKKATSPSERIKMMGLGFVAMLVLLFCLWRTVNHLTIILSILTGFVVYCLTRFNHSCSYIGERGFVKYTVKGSRASRPKSVVFLFQEDMTLYVKKMRIHINSGYFHTLYYFTWKRGNRKQHEFTGRFNQYRKLESNHPLHFAHAVEAAWSHYLQGKLAYQLELGGYMEFPVKSSFKAIRLGAGFVEFVPRYGQPKRLLKEKIKAFKFGNGRLEFIPHDAKWVELFNKYTFRYEAIANAQLFMILLASLTDISITQHDLPQ